MSNKDRLLMAVLECGDADLSVLDDTQYDLGEIVDNLKINGSSISLNSITDEIFRKGRAELKQAVKNAIQSRKDLQHETDDTEEGEMEYESLQEEIDALESLDPDKDMNWYCNWLDTSCWLSENEAVYWEYLEEEIKSIEDNMGFTF